MTQVPVSRSERLAAAQRLKDEVIDLRKIPERLLAGHLRKVFAAGWCIRDIVSALEKTPAGQVYQTRGPGGMRSVLAWLHIRLKAWRCEDGSLLPSPTANERAEAQRVREAAIARVSPVAHWLGNGLSGVALRMFVVIYPRFFAAGGAVV